MRLRKGRPPQIAALVALAVMAFGSGQAALAQASAISVVLGPDPQVQTAILNPGFILTLRFDRPVTHVAVGDQRVIGVRAGGWMGRDLVLQPLQTSGETNLHVWAGEAVTLWEIVIAPSVPRTADLVLVRIKGRLPPPERLPTVEARGGEKVLGAEITKDGLVATFSVERRPTGVAVRYRIRNGSTRAYRLNPALSAVWADGKAVPFLLLREVAGVEPTVLLPGASESGVFTISRSARTLRVLLPLYPDGMPGQLPVWFEPIFSGVDRLEASPDG